jgi:diguanylate cyclase (GGDEF)-like protein
MIITTVLIGLFAVICSFIFDPFVVFSKNLYMLLTLSNIFSLFVGIVVQLLIGNFIRRIIAENNILRIETLSKEANTDHLTDLLNRRSAEPAFLEISAAEEQIPYCIALLDIDDFKVINDTLGHGCGDEVLVFLARFLKSNFRKSDLVFRWGGEEFLMILKNTAIGTAYTILNKLRHRLEQEIIETSVKSICITVTIGVSAMDLSLDLADNIEKADKNMYIGKKSGKNMVVTDS